MEFDTSKTKPESTLNFLLQQVAKQSEVCDVTVKKGTWERKYHRCVLIASPFFKCRLKNDFVEKYTGIIKINGGSPESIDKALKFLYGEDPKLSDNNIEAIFDLAEFFMIPNLKSACVKWVNSQTISCDNCLSWLQLSSIYEFELPKCITFIESHLDEVFVHQQCLSLTYESINYIFKEETFRYLHMEQRLLFLIRWYKAQPENRRQWVQQLLETIAFDEIPTSCLHEIKRDPVAEEMLHDVHVNFQHVDETVDVLINDTKNDGVILCFDLRRNAWFKITSAALKGTIRFKNVVGTNPEVSELLLADIKEVYYTHTLYKLHLDSDELETYKVVNEDSGSVMNSLSVFHFSNNLCVICNKVKAFMQPPVQKIGMEGDRNSPSLHKSLLYADSSLNWKPRYKNTSMVLIGKIVDGKVEMLPRFSITDCGVLSVTANTSSVVALILQSREHVLVYDTVECTLDKLKINTGYKDMVFSADHGFVIHNIERCITIRRISGPALSMRYKAYEYNLHNRREGIGNIPEYYFCNNIWYRYVRDPHSLRRRFQCADHDMVAEASSPNNVKWTELTPPDEATYYLRNSMFFVKIPRLLQLCHINCPHCKKATQIQSVCKVEYDYNDLYYGHGYDYDSPDVDSYNVIGFNSSDDYSD